MFRHKVYESETGNFGIHESNDVGSPESNSVETTSEDSSSKEGSSSADSELNSESSKVLKQIYPNDSEKEKESDEEKQSEVEPVSENNDVAEEKKSEEESYDKPVRTFYNQIDSVAMDDGETDENIIDQLLHNIRQMQIGNSIENLDDSVEPDRKWIDVSEAEREIEELEKQAQKELEEEVNKVLGELFENAATAVLDELTKDDSKSDENHSSSDSEEDKVESGERNNLVNTDERSENKSQDAVDSMDIIVKNVSEHEPELATAIEQVQSSEETNSEESIQRAFWKMFSEEANKDNSIVNEKSTDNDEIKSSEGTTEAPEVAPVIARKVEPEDIMAIVAKKLEPIVGENQELLLWYLANKDKPIFETANDPLKVNTAKMLYSTNVREYGQDSSAVINLIADESYEKEFEKLMNPAYGKIQPETKVQQEIVFRLQEKSNIFNKLQEEATSFEETMYTELIEAYNAIDKATAQQAIEEINDRAKEDESIEEATDNYFLVDENKDDNEATKEASEPIIDNGNASPLQSLLQAMRNVGTFQDKSEGTELQDTINYNKPAYRIFEPRQYFSDEDVLGTYDPLLAEREEPMMDPTYQQHLYEILQNIMEGSKIEEEQDNQDIHEKLEEDSKDADEEEKSFQAEQQDALSETDSDTTQEIYATTDASQNVADKYYRDLLEMVKNDLMPEGMYASDEDFYTSVIAILHNMAERKEHVFLPFSDVLDAIRESNKSRQSLKDEDQSEQENQDIQEKLEEDSKDTYEEEKKSQSEQQNALSETDMTQEITTSASINLEGYYRNLLEALKNEYKTDLVPEGLYTSDEDFYTSVIPIVQRTEEERQNGAMSIDDFINAIEESNKSRELLKDEDQEHLVSRENQDVQNSEEIQPDQSNQEEAEIQPDQSNQEEAEIQPDQSNPEEAEIQPDQSNQEEADVEPDQSNQEETEIQPDQSNQEESEVQPDQSNQEETEVQRDQPNQEEPEEQPSINEFLSYYGADDYDY